MPGAPPPGRRAPVRGEAPSSLSPPLHPHSHPHSHSLDAVPSTSPSSSSISDSAARSPPSPAHGALHSRGGAAMPMSSGYPARAAAVPFFGHTASGMGMLPLSPPPTPPSSPPLRAVGAAAPAPDSAVVGGGMESLSDATRRLSISPTSTLSASTGSVRSRASRRSNSSSSHSVRSGSSGGSSSAAAVAASLLRAAAATVAVTRERVPPSQDASSAALAGAASSSSSRAAPAPSTSPTSPGSSAICVKSPPPSSSCAFATATAAAEARGILMPATPEPTPTTMSPADLLRHHPVASALSFLSSLYPAMPTPPPQALGVAQDASLELVCGLGWSGALLVNASSRTLHVALPSTLRDGPLRDDVLALLDYASERLRASRVVLALKRGEMREFGSVLHGLCYVGAVVVAHGGDRELLRPKEGVVLAAIDL